MKTVGDGYPFTIMHFKETIDPKFASVGPRIATSAGTKV